MRPDQGEFLSAIGSMNHIAFDVAPEHIEEYRERLIAAGVPCSEIWNHDNSEWGISEELTDDVFIRSVYFQDPDGILLELACWLRRAHGRGRRDRPRARRRALSPVD